MTNKMHSVTWSADGVLTIDGAGDCVEVQPAPNTTRDAFEAWLDEPHPIDTTSTRRDYMPKHDGGFSRMVWQAATQAATLAAQDKRQPLTDEQIIDLAEQWPAETNDWASHFDFARAIESAHGIKAE